jgi:hypothetical protein
MVATSWSKHAAGTATQVFVIKTGVAYCDGCIVVRWCWWLSGASIQNVPSLQRLGNQDCVCVASENSSKKHGPDSSPFSTEIRSYATSRQSNSQYSRFSPAVNGHGPLGWETKVLESLAKEPVIQTLQLRRPPVQNKFTVCRYGRRTKNMTEEVTWFESLRKRDNTFLSDVLRIL